MIINVNLFFIDFPVKSSRNLQAHVTSTEHRMDLDESIKVLSLNVSNKRYTEECEQLLLNNAELYQNTKIAENGQFCVLSQNNSFFSDSNSNSSIDHFVYNNWEYNKFNLYCNNQPHTMNTSLSYCNMPIQISQTNIN